MGVLPIVVMSALIISLVEALMILPCHMADSLRQVRRDLSTAPPRHWIARFARPLREKQQYLIQTVLGGRYEWLLRRATKYRYVTVAAACSLLLMSLGLVAGGYVEFVMIQKMDSETLLVNLEMPVGNARRPDRVNPGSHRNVHSRRTAVPRGQVELHTCRSPNPGRRGRHHRLGALASWADHHRTSQHRAARAPKHRQSSPRCAQQHTTSSAPMC